MRDSISVFFVQRHVSDLMHLFSAMQRIREEVAAECDSCCKQKYYFLIYLLKFSHVMC